MPWEAWLEAQALCCSSLVQEKLPFAHCWNASFPKRCVPVFPPAAERQPNRLLPASPSRDAGIAAKMALRPRSYPENGCRWKAGFGGTQRGGGAVFHPLHLRAGVQMRGGAGGGWLPAAAADGSLILCMLLVSFFTRMISKIKFTHVVFCNDYWMTGKEEGKRGCWQRLLVDTLLLLKSVSKRQIHPAIPLV